MDIKKKKRLMTAGIILCAAVFVFSGVILAREYIDQKRRAEKRGLNEVLIGEDNLPSILLYRRGQHMFYIHDYDFF